MINRLSQVRFPYGPLLGHVPALVGGPVVNSCLPCLTRMGRSGSVITSPDPSRGVLARPSDVAAPELHTLSILLVNNSIVLQGGPKTQSVNH